MPQSWQLSRQSGDRVAGQSPLPFAPQKGIGDADVDGAPGQDLVALPLSRQVIARVEAGVLQGGMPAADVKALAPGIVARASLPGSMDYRAETTVAAAQESPPATSCPNLSS